MKKVFVEDGWIKCAKCGHKLAKAVTVSKYSPETVSGEIGGNNALRIEFKCQSCKEINYYEVKK